MPLTARRPTNQPFPRSCNVLYLWEPRRPGGLRSLRTVIARRWKSPEDVDRCRLCAKCIIPPGEDVCLLAFGGYVPPDKLHLASAADVVPAGSPGHPRYPADPLAEDRASQASSKPPKPAPDPALLDDAVGTHAEPAEPRSAFARLCESLWS